MKLTTITLDGFQGHSRRFDLSQVTGIIAPNFAGKTAILNAINIALLGRHPSIGASGEKLATFGTDQGWNIEATFGNGAQNKVSLNRKGGKNSLTESRGVDVPPVLLDVQKEFFSLTQAQRISLLVSNGLTQTVSSADFVAELDAIEIVPTTETKPHLINLVAEANDKMQALPPVKALESLRDNWTSTKKNVVADRKAASATLVALRQNGLTPKDQTQALAIADKEYQDANRAHAVLKEQVVAHQRFVEKRNQNQETQKQLQKLEGDRETIANTLAGSLKEFGTPNVAVLEMEYSDLSKACLNAIQNVTMLNHSLTEIDNQRAAAKHRLDELDEAECCPFCKGSDTGWKTNVIQEATNAFDNADKRYLTASQLRVATLRDQTAAQSAAQSAADSARGRLTEAKRILTQQQGFQNSIKATEQQIASLKQVMASAQAQEPARPDETALVTVDKRVTDAALKLEPLRKEQALWNQYQGAKEQRKFAEQKLLDFTHQESALEACIGVVQKWLKELSGGVFEGLLEVANRFCDQILESPLEYNSDLNDIGRWRNGQWASHTVFSGCETLIAYAGLSVALAQRSPYKLVMLDEMGVVHPSLKMGIVTRLRELIRDGTLDQALFCDVSSIDYQIDEFDLTEKETASFIHL